MTDPVQAQGGQTGDDKAMPAVPVIPDGDAVYDLLMGAIEPELTSAVVETLKEKYKDETPEQAKARAERYEKAFDAYDKALDEYTAGLNRNIDDYSHHAVTALEGISRTDEAKDIDALESQINENTL